MNDVPISRIAWLAGVVAIQASCLLADHNTANSLTGTVTVAFVFPDGTNRQASLTYGDVLRILTDNPVPKGVPIGDYKIDWWIFGALQHLKIPFEVQKNEGEVSFTKIGSYGNDATRRWVYYL